MGTKKAVRGNARMKELGMKRLELWFHPEQVRAIQKAAKRCKAKPSVFAKSVLLFNAREVNRGTIQVEYTTLFPTGDEPPKTAKKPRAAKRAAAKR